jgi:predicted PurR-regulated permease PerM
MARSRGGLVEFSQRIVWPLGALILVLVLLRLSPLPLKHVFTVLFTAILVASAISPASRRLARYGIPRGITILLLYISASLILAGVIALLVPLVADEVTSLQSSLPQYAREAQAQLARVAPNQAAHLSDGSIVTQLSNSLSTLAESLTGAAFAFISTGINIILILVMAYFMAAEENFARLVIRRFVPPPQRDQATLLMGRIGTRLGEWARAQLLLALFFGVAFGLGLRLAGVHYAVTLAVVGAVLEIIPYVGGFITVTLAVLVTLTQQPILAIWVLVWYGIVVELENHVIAPKLMDKVLGIHPLVIVVALFLGAESLGILGALLAVPIAIVFQVLLDEFYIFSEPEVQPVPEIVPARGNGTPALQGEDRPAGVP